MTIRTAFALTAFCVASVLGPWPAIAQTFVEVTMCDSVSIGGQVYPRITYSLHNLAKAETAMTSYVMHPVPHDAPGDTCHFLQLTAPVGWGGFFIPNGPARWGATSFSNAIPVGGTLEGFQVVMSRPSCCFLFLYSSPIDTPYAGETVCFECDLATPARPSTWGRLKQLYR